MLNYQRVPVFCKLWLLRKDHRSHGEPHRVPPIPMASWILSFPNQNCHIFLCWMVCPSFGRSQISQKKPKMNRTWNFSSESWFSESRRACDDGHSRDLATSSRSTEVLLQVTHISSQLKTTIYLPKWWIFHSHLSFPKDFTTFFPRRATRGTRSFGRLSLPSRSPFVPEMPRSPPKLSFGQFPESSFKWFFWRGDHGKMIGIWDTLW